MKLQMFIAAFVVTISMVAGIDRERLAHYPQPQNNFDLDKYLGGWFNQAFLVPNSAIGFRYYSDYSCNYTKKHDESISFVFNYRAPRCVTIVNSYLPMEKPGVFLLQDVIGDAASGTSIVVDTDYDTYAVKWGCTRDYHDNNCRDPYVVGKTRLPNPADETLNIIKKKFRDLWGLTFKDVTLYTHDSPCTGSPETCPDDKQAPRE